MVADAVDADAEHLAVPLRELGRAGPATVPSSVVQTGVKSFGCEKRMAQPSPIHSWKRIAPAVVSAVKSGATSLILQ